MNRKCQRCGVPTTDEHTRCQPCIDVTRAERNRLRDAAFADNKCVNCLERTIEPGFKTCSYCRKTRRDRNARFRKRVVVKPKPFYGQPASCCAQCCRLSSGPLDLQVDAEGYTMCRRCETEPVQAYDYARGYEPPETFVGPAQQYARAAIRSQSWRVNRLQYGGGSK